MLYQSPAAGVKMTDNEPVPWRLVAQVYWSIFWRTALMYFVIHAPFDALYLWLIATGRLDESMDLFALRLVLVWLIMLGSGLIALKSALGKRYHGFRIQIIREPVS